MTENDLLAAVLDLAKVLGWKVAHFRPAMTAKGWRTPVSADGGGFPDLVMAGPIRANGDPCRVLFVELKAGRGKMSEAQWSWKFRLMPNSHVWTPKEWNDGTILAELKALEEAVEPFRHTTVNPIHDPADCLVCPSPSGSPEPPKP